MNRAIQNMEKAIKPMNRAIHSMKRGQQSTTGWLRLVGSLKL